MGVREVEREPEVLQGIGRGLILEREENLDTKRLMKGDEGSLQQEYGGEAIEGTSDAYEWVDFKRNEGLPSGVILSSEPLKENFEDAKDYETMQLRSKREASSESCESFQSASEEIKIMVDVGTQTDEDVISCLIM